MVFRTFLPGDEVAFRELNEAWITTLFGMEEKDREILSDPVGHILNEGGHIVMAVDGDCAVGCCALVTMEPGCFELSKMAVHEGRRGTGIGRKLLEYAVQHARDVGAKRLYLETNTKLPNAIHLYEAVGFRHLPPERVRKSPFARSNVQMEMWLG